jgi:hypothetical protein
LVKEKLAVFHILKPLKWGFFYLEKSKCPNFLSFWFIPPVILYSDLGLDYLSTKDSLDFDSQIPKKGGL